MYTVLAFGRRAIQSGGLALRAEVFMGFALVNFIEFYAIKQKFPFEAATYNNSSFYCVPLSWDRVLFIFGSFYTEVLIVTGVKL